MWRKLLIALLPFLAAGYIGYSVYPYLHKKPAPPESELIVKHDTLYFFMKDTIIPPPVIVSESMNVSDTMPMSISDTTPERVRTTYHELTYKVNINLEMYAKCKVDSIHLEVIPAPIIHERKKLVVCTDTIKTITIIKEKKSWWRDVKNVVLCGAIVYLWVSTKNYWEK